MFTFLFTAAAILNWAYSLIVADRHAPVSMWYTWQGVLCAAIAIALK